MPDKAMASAVAKFGAAAHSKLANIAISGAPEDQLRSPVEALLHDLAELGGLPSDAVHLVGETTLKHLKTRPDFAVTRDKALVGFIEIKAPGKGADPRRFNKESHDGQQWEKLKALPNLQDGTIGATPFSAEPLTLKEIMSTEAPLASQALGVSMSGPFTGLKVDLGGGTLLSHPGIEEVEADPYASSTYTQLVTSLGGGLYDSSLTLDFTFATTLNGGGTWITEDPTLTLENFNPANYPNLAPLLGVPEPATLALFGAGLLGLGFNRRRRIIKPAL